MLGITHVTTGIVLYLMLDNPDPLGVFVSGASALLPDIDHHRSTLGGFTPAHLIWRHRGFTHSFVALTIVSILSVFYLPLPFAWAVIIGYGSHIMLDLLNVQGCMLLWPSSHKYKLALMRVGTLWEYLLVGCVVVVLVFLKGGM